MIRAPEARGVRFSVAVYGHPPAHVRALVARAEQLGFDGAWLGEHVLAPATSSTPHPHRPADDPPIVGLGSDLADPWVLIGALASATRRIRLCTGVLVLPLRHPLLVARSAVTACELSRGRVVLGVGSGWMREEFDALGVPFGERGRRCDEAIEVLRKLFAGGPAGHDGRFHRFAPVQVTARPVAIPLVVGGVSEPALRRAADRADGWYTPSTLLLEECVELRARIEALRREAGTAERHFTHHVRISEYPRRDVVQRYVQAGFDDLTVSGFELWPPALRLTLDDKLAELERCATELQLPGAATGTPDER